jgi:thermospermine synthase
MDTAAAPTTDTAAAVTTIDNQRSKSYFTFTEAIFPGVVITIELNKILSSSTSQFQEVQVIDTSFGRTLVTDGKTQSAEMDEFVYHESLVHPSLLKATLGTGAGPKSVFIGGGGELATAREVLRHKSVERLVMVDLDAKVVEECKKHLPEWGGEEVANNPRLELVIGDAYEYLNNCNDKFDAIIMDISDPIEAGPGVMLYTQEFYQHANSLLNPGGVFVTQGGIGDGNFVVDGTEPGSAEDETAFAAIKNTLQTTFDCVLPYTVNVPSFGSDWGYVMAYNNTTNSGSSASSIDDFINHSPDKLDELIDECITDISDADSKSVTSKKGSDVLKYYDGLTHRRMFTLPKTLRVRMAKDKRIMTKDNPVFMY